MHKDAPRFETLHGRSGFTPRSAGALSSNRGVKPLLQWVALAVAATAMPLTVRLAAAPTIREPAVAGLFYPRDPAALSHAIDGYLAAAADRGAPGELKALICPHAGYPYSGPVAASGYRLLRGQHYQQVFVLGPSHYAYLTQASVSGADIFRTPLGDVPISAKARELGRLAPFAIEPPAQVERPDWASQSSRSLPAAGAENANTWEHADEVEVPFLQKTLGQFELVPVVMGEVDPTDAARALSLVVDDHSLIVVSSDLSHYHPYADARRRDQRTVDAICALRGANLTGQDACGYVPVRTLLVLAKQRGWQPRLLDLRNSGDTAGDKSRVVGYAAIAFYAPAKSAAPSALTPADRTFLLKLARDAVTSAAANGTVPVVPAAELTPELNERRGVFVTLTKQGDLRGCIGNLGAELPLYRAVVENARSAALRDPRFAPVRPGEVRHLAIEISILTPPQPLAFASADDLLRKLKPGEDGVVLKIDAGAATYLPQVWEQLPDKVEFLNSLAQKAGGRPEDWRKPGTAVEIYHVVSFQEETR